MTHTWEQVIPVLEGHWGQGAMEYRDRFGSNPLFCIVGGAGKAWHGASWWFDHFLRMTKAVEDADLFIAAAEAVIYHFPDRMPNTSPGYEQTSDVTSAVAVVTEFNDHRLTTEADAVSLVRYLAYGEPIVRSQS